MTRARISVTSQLSSRVLHRGEGIEQGCQFGPDLPGSVVEQILEPVVEGALAAKLAAVQFSRCRSERRQPRSGSLRIQAARRMP